MENTSEVTPECMDESQSIGPVEMLQAPQASSSYVKFAGPAIRSIMESESENEA